MCAIEENGSKGGCVVGSGERVPCQIEVETSVRNLQLNGT